MKHKTTIVIYSEYDPRDGSSLSEIARDAESGDAICSEWIHEEVSDDSVPEGVAEFFGLLEGEEV